MAYQMTPTPVTFSAFVGHSQVAGLFICNPSNICTSFYTTSTDSVLAWSLWVSWPSCQLLLAKVLY